MFSSIERHACRWSFSIVFFWDVFESKGGDLGDEIPVASIEILPLRARLTPHDQ